MRPLLSVLVVVVAVSALPSAPKGGTEGNFEKIVSHEGIETKNQISARSDRSLEDILEDYVKDEEFSFELPFVGSTVTMNARNLDQEEVNVKLNFGSGREVEARKKSKIKKAFIPILVFIFIKAIILIPLALAILGFKTWNAIQLAFVSFVTAAALAIWKFCSKISHDHHPAVVHNAWEPHLDRTDAQQIAYSAYAPMQ